jgi:hypothetical protein
MKTPPANEMDAEICALFGVPAFALNFGPFVFPAHRCGFGGDIEKSFRRNPAVATQPSFPLLAGRNMKRAAAKLWIENILSISCGPNRCPLREVVC